MKRHLKTLVVLIMCLGFLLGACQGSKTEKSEDGYVIGHDIYFLGNTWSVQLAREFEKGVVRYPKVREVIYTDSSNDVQRQIANVEDLITRGVDAIILTPISPTALIPVLTQAQNAGIKVILNAATIEGTCYDALVTVDDLDFGRVGAEWLVKQLNGKGNIIMLDGLAGISVSDDRSRGAMNVFNQYPDINIVAQGFASWDYATAKILVSDMLAANPRIDGVWSQGGGMTQGAIEAFSAAGRPLVPMTGEDANGFLKLWKQYQPQGFTSIAVSKPTWISLLALEAAIDLLDGKPVTKDNFLAVPVFSDDELDKFLRTDLSDSLFVNTYLSDAEIREMFPN